MLSTGLGVVDYSSKRVSRRVLDHSVRVCSTSQNFWKCPSILVIVPGRNTRKVRPTELRPNDEAPGAASSGPTFKVFLRPSDRDRLLMLAGINPIVSKYQLRKRGRQSVSLAQVSSQRFDPGVYSQPLMEDLLTVRERLMKLKSYGRLRFNNSFQIAGCALAVRIATRNHRHGHRMPQIPRVRTTAKRLLNRLEVLRKRAKRAELRQIGADAHKEKAHEWRRFVVWVRVHLANCDCAPRRKVMSGRNRLIITTLVDWTREELENRNARVPDKSELTRLVRLALRYVRRGRKGYGVLTLLNDKVFAASQFATFVTLRLDNPSNRKNK